MPCGSRIATIEKSRLDTRVAKLRKTVVAKVDYEVGLVLGL